MLRRAQASQSSSFPLMEPTSSLWGRHWQSHFTEKQTEPEEGGEEAGRIQHLIPSAALLPLKMVHLVWEVLFRDARRGVCP